MNNPQGRFPYPRDIEDWKCAHYFNWDDEAILHMDPRRKRRYIVMEETHNLIVNQMAKAAAEGSGPKSGDNGETTVYDKNAGGFTKKPEEMDPNEQFASFASQAKPQMTIQELRAEAARLAKQG